MLLLKAVGDLKQPWLLYRTDGPQLLKSTSSYQQKPTANGLGACLRCGGKGALVEWVVQHLFNPHHVLPVARDELSHWLSHLLQRCGVLENLDRRDCQMETKLSVIVLLHNLKLTGRVPDCTVQDFQPGSLRKANSSCVLPN